MTEKMDICNMALALLKQEPVASLDERSENARRLKLFYDPMRLEMLRTHDWAFARRTARLAQLDLPQDEKPQGACAFAYPPEAVWVSRIISDGGRRWSRGEFKVCSSAASARRFLLVPAPEFDGGWAEYTADVKDPAQFDPAFVKLFALGLACDLAATLCGSETVRKTLYQEFLLKREEARQADKEEGRAIPVQTSSFEEVR